MCGALLHWLGHIPSNQAESVTVLQAEVERWAAVIKKVGLEPQ